MSDDDDNTVQRFPASIAEDGDDPDLTPADAETGYMHEGADEDEYNDEEPFFVPVERWEMQRCSCDRSTNPREVPVPGERHPRCFECGKPRPRLPLQSAQATSPLDAVVAAVAQATSPLDTEDDSDAELALQIEKILADPVGNSGEQLHASASSGEQFRWPLS